MKSWKERFETRFEKKVVNSKDLCKQNKELFKEFFEYEKKKLKRTNQKGKLDEPNFNNMYNLLTRMLVVNGWFNNKPWVNLTKQDIEKVYDELLDGKIKRKDKKPYDPSGLASSYFNKIMKSKPFELAGKADLCREIIVTHRPNKEVRYIEDETFLEIERNVYKPIHKLLLWLAWDVGENINALLRTKKSDYNREINPDTNEPEYRVNLRNEILKRSRRARGVITNLPETTKLLDQILKDYNDDDLLFNFGYRSAKKIIDRAVERANARCKPNGEKVTWKDLRSGMACNLLKKGWTTDEVNSRLGHKPSSDEIDKYINFLALDMHRPKKKVEEFKTKRLEKELEEMKEREKLYSSRMEIMKKQLEENTKILESIALQKVIKKI